MRDPPQPEHPNPLREPPWPEPVRDPPHRRRELGSANLLAGEQIAHRVDGCELVVQVVFDLEFHHVFISSSAARRRQLSTAG